MAAVCATGASRPAAQGQAVRACAVVYDVATGRTTSSDDALCATRLPPASTFKIPHALVALETGAVTVDTRERWDGTKYPGRPGWERDHTVLSAIRPSAVWFFQRIAPRVGASRMHDWLTTQRYGNADTSGPVTQYWLNGRLRVSPLEQVDFLRRFYVGGLPVAASHAAAVQTALVQDPGTVENATGIHRLDVVWRPGTILSAKTGATQADDGTHVSWLVGQLTVGARNYVFASAVWRLNQPVDGLAGTARAVQAFVERGLFADAPR